MAKSFQHNDSIITKDSIKEKLLTNDAWLWRGIRAIYSFQTDAEKSSGATVEDNGVGFNGVDAEILTSFAHQLAIRGFLTPKQNVIARKKMTKYAGQLYRIAESKQQ